MSELPSHTDTGSAPAEAAIAPGSRRRRWAAVIGGVALVVVVVVLHATGVIEMGGHG
jgi:hypothetical protein